VRSFFGFGQVPYIGQPYAQPIKLTGITGRAVPLLFQWLSYGASSTVNNINVLVSLENAMCKALDQIRSIYIDNLGSDNPVYVNFPDMNYTIVAKPNSEGWYPVFTNARVFSVVGEGFLTGDIPQTFILATNIPQIPAVNVELDQAKSLLLASPVISRGTSIYNAALGTPALADQLNTPNINVGILNSVPLWGTPYPSGFIYVNSIFLAPQGVTAAAAGLFSLQFESTGVAGLLFTTTVLVYPTGIAAPSLPGNITFFSGANIKLDATQTWRVRVLNIINTLGVAQIYSSFTQVP
jgi:hypothetical protein